MARTNIELLVSPQHAHVLLVDICLANLRGVAHLDIVLSLIRALSAVNRTHLP